MWPHVRADVKPGQRDSILSVRGSEQGKPHFREWYNYLKAFRARGEEKGKTNILKIDAVSGLHIPVASCGPLHSKSSGQAISQHCEGQPCSAHREACEL